MSENLEFKILALDASDQCVIHTEKNLLYSLMSNSQLWDNAELDESRRRIVDTGKILEVKSVKTEEDMEVSIDKVFLIYISGEYSKLEPLRRPISAYLQHQKFDYLYILTDQVSEKIACEIYPLLYRVENLLRGYLIKFMTTRLGPTWWEMTATGELSQKVYQRRKNEPIFGAHIDNNAYLIDFGDLGRLIYAYSSGFTSKEDIVRRIAEVEETPEAIKELKEQLQSNYHKFFKESFKDKGFQEKWELLEKIRHKVAHNNLFTNADLIEGKNLAEELIRLIVEATNTMDEVVLRKEEKQAIKNTFIFHGYTWDVIKEEEFLKELKSREEYFTEKNGFVGLAHFVKDYLGAKGYDYKSSYLMAERLEAQDLVEMYQVDNPYEERPVTAIRIKESKCLQGV